MANNKKPNFLIVGMAKCGTTSLSQYMQQHPDVFISEKKEPRFITSQSAPLPLGGPKDDLVEAWYVKKVEDYLDLFKDASEKAIGEASADTLFFYRSTIPFIKDFIGDPKILIILRNPVKRAFSAYQHLVRDGREELTFEEGLLAEEERIKMNYELIYFYKTAGLYYEPVRAFLKEFTSVKIILNDDLINNTQCTLSDVFDFLEVNPNYTVDTSLKHNVSGFPKNRFLQDSFKKDSLIRKLIKPLTRTLLPTKRLRIHVMNWLYGKNLTRMVLNPDTEKELIDFFKQDIEHTGKLIGRDLTQWFQN